MDVTDQIAKERIKAREGHFYEGAPPSERKEEKDTGDTKHKSRATEGKNSDEDNSQWKFAAVTYPHVVLDGTKNVDINAHKVVETLNSITQ